jgi:hypothetical protein
MKSLPVIFVYVFLLCVTAVYAQPVIPQGQIPSNIPSDVRQAVEELYAADA